jgi:hypothetical protein
MLKHALLLALVVALVAGGVFVGYRKGLSTARHAEQLSRPVSAGTAMPVAGAAESMPGDDFTLMQRPVARSLRLDSAPMVGLFGPPVISGDPNPSPIRIDYGIPIANGDVTSASGKFNFNVGDQF